MSFDDDLGFDVKTHQPRDDQGQGSLDECCDEVSLDLLLGRELEHLPKHDYLTRIRSGDLDLGLRKEALDWITKAHAHYAFGALSFCLAVNYLDRFLSVYELPGGKAWIVQLLAVACLSLAAKLAENKMPAVVDLQEENPKYLFEGKTIMRMEVLVLNTLKWRMQATTPFSFVEYFLGRLNTTPPVSSKPLIDRSTQLILTITKGIDFIEFKPSEIAAAVAMSVSAKEMQAALDMGSTLSCFLKVEKGKVMKCMELIKDLTLMGKPGNASIGGGGGTVPSIPKSPVGVLEAANLSYKSDGSCPNSSSHSKRRKT